METYMERLKGMLRKAIENDASHAKSLSKN
jgi:hypothetical protein